MIHLDSGTTKSQHAVKQRQTIKGNNVNSNPQRSCILNYLHKEFREYILYQLDPCDKKTDCG